MKLSVCVMMLSVLTVQLLVAAPGYGQKAEDKMIRLELSNDSLRGALNKIERLSGFRIAYLLEQVTKYTDISLAKKERSVAESLHLILANTLLDFRQEDNTILIFQKTKNGTAPAAGPGPGNPLPPPVRGRVVNAEGEPIQGVTVSLKGVPNTGTVSDARGAFEIGVSGRNTVLVFSYVGMQTQEVAVNGQTEITVVLTESQAQQKEVVVVGYGTQKRHELTSSISTIGNKEINELPVVGVDQALQGRVAGVTVTNVSSPGTAPDVRIRGVSSISFATNPLYVIDGFPTTNLSSFDNRDVESVEVLKDASAAAIYGSRATNGVIIITTKKGAKNRKLHVVLDSYVGFEKAWRLLKYMGTAERMQFMDEMFGGDNIADSAHRPTRYTPAEMAKPAYPGATQSYGETNTDWQGLYFRTGLITSHNVSVTGGGEASTFYASAGYMKQEGIVQFVGFDRYNFRLNSTHQIGRRVSFGENLLISYTNQRYNNADGATGDQGTPLAQFAYALPHIPLRDPITGWWLKAGGDAIDGHPFPNLIADNGFSKTYYKTTKVFGSAFVDVKLTGWLKFRSTAGVDYYDQLNAVDNQTYVTYDGQNVIPTNDGLSFIANNRTVYTSLLFSQQLSFDKYIAGDHHVSATLVYETQKATTNIELMSGNQEGDAPTTLTGATSISALNTLDENFLLSYVARVGYGYKGKYLLNASIRRDGSSVWAPGNKYANFPSASIGWNIAREAFMERQTAINDLKIRASYGITGLNPTALGSYPWQSLINSSSYPFNNASGVNTAFYNKLGNENLEWEKTTQKNIGLDLGLFNDRFTLSAEYFDRTTDNLILQSPTPPSFGYVVSTDENVGKMQNKGWEMELGYNSPAKGDFRWNATGNISVVRNKVLRLNTADGVIYGGDGNFFSSWGYPVTRTKAGDPIQSFYGFDLDRIYQTQAEVDNDNAHARTVTGNPNAYYQTASTKPGDVRFADLNGDGIVNDDDRKVIGNFLPDFTYGLNFIAKYKHFDLSILFQGVQGGEIFSAIGVYGAAFRYPLGGSAKAFEAAWTSAHPSKTNPRIVYGDPNGNSNFSQRWLQDASYLRLKNINIGYEIPAELLTKRPNGVISKFRVYVTSQNLLTFTKYNLGYDPEIGAKLGSNRGNGNLTNGIDYGQYPAARSFILGLQVGF